MTTPDAAVLTDLLARAVPDAPPDPSGVLRPEDEDEGVHQLIYSILLCNSTHAAAGAALGAIRSAYADYNDLRADVPGKVAAVIKSSKPPRGAPDPTEQAVRLNDALAAVFLRAHATSLASVGTLSKRDARTYLDELPGVPRFVSARVALTVFGAHGVPIDHSTAAALAAAGVLDAGAAPDDASAKLERVVRATDALGTHLRLEAWREQGFPSGKGSKKRPPARKATSKRAPKARR